MKYPEPKFIKSAVQPKDFPIIKNDRGLLLPEIALAGRSNVGKSSLLNDLFLTKQFVKTSSIPGKTQHINFFTLNHQQVFVDLPGYGYAHVPLEVKKKWGPMIQGYLENRAQLQLILFLLDIRRIPSVEDQQFLDWVIFHQKPVILIFTKVDKVTQNEKNQQTAKIIKALNIENLDYIYYSVLKRIGRQELFKKVTQLEPLADL